METIRYSPIGKEDISFGTGSFEVTLADGRVVMLTQVDIGAILNAGLSTLNLTGLTLTTPTFAGVITFSTAPVFSTLTAKSMAYLDATSALASTAAPTNGQLLIGSTGAIPVLATLTAGGGISITNAAGAITIGSAPRSYLAGYGCSTAGSSTTLTIAAGQCTDSTNTQTITLASALAKTTGSWVVGSTHGGLDTGSIQASTTYHFYAILRLDTGVVDVTFSTNATTPTLPANYTLYRYIGSFQTDGSSNWVAFVQDGDYVRLLAPVLSYNVTNPGTSALTVTLGSVPTGFNLHAVINVLIAIGASGNPYLYMSDLASNDVVPGASTNVLAQLVEAGANSQAAWGGVIRTNTSAQIRVRTSFSDGSTVLQVATLGWWNYRGRNA